MDIAIPINRNAVKIRERILCFFLLEIIIQIIEVTIIIKAVYKSTVGKIGLAEMISPCSCSKSIRSFLAVE